MLVIIMGVAGSGKTTIGELLSSRLGYSFADADDFHSEANKQKMSCGMALTDKDRDPWLAALRTQIEAWLAAHQGGVLCCSALKASYRLLLGGADRRIRFVYLRGDESLIRRRLAGRTHHFVNEQLLPSQLAALEEPSETEAIVVDASWHPEQIVLEIERRLRQ